MRKALAPIAILLLMNVPTPAEDASGEESPATSGNATCTLIVEGMHCGGCAHRVKKAARLDEGVSEVEVDLGTKEVVVTYDPEKTDAEKIREAVSKAYDAKLKESDAEKQDPTEAAAERTD